MSHSLIGCSFFASVLVRSSTRGNCNSRFWELGGHQRGLSFEVETTYELRLKGSGTESSKAGIAFVIVVVATYYFSVSELLIRKHRFSIGWQ